MINLETLSREMPSSADSALSTSYPLTRRLAPLEPAALAVRLMVRLMTLCPYDLINSSTALALASSTCHSRGRERESIAAAPGRYRRAPRGRIRVAIGSGVTVRCATVGRRARAATPQRKRAVLKLVAPRRLFRR